MEQRAEEEKRTGKKRESAWKGSPLFSKEKRAKQAKQTMKTSIANIRNTVQGVLARNKKKEGAGDECTLLKGILNDK